MKIRCVKVGGQDPFFENFTKGKVYDCTEYGDGFLVNQDTGLELYGEVDINDVPFIPYFHSEFRIVE